MTTSDNGLKTIVADLHDMGYTDAEIAMVVQRSERRVGQILKDLKPRPQRVRSIDDLPHDMRERVRNWLDVQKLNVTLTATG